MNFILDHFILKVNIEIFENELKALAKQKNFCSEISAQILKQNMHMYNK